MKPIKLVIKNFKKIKDVDIDIPDDAKIMIVRGDNGLGKTTILQAFELALGDRTHLSVKPLRDGALKGFIELTTKDAEGKEFIFRTKFKDGDSKPTFEVEAEDGRHTQIGYINALVGSINFDPFKFVEMSSTVKGKQEQVEIVKSYIHPDVLQELKKTEAQIDQYYDERTEQNRENKTLQGFIAESGLDQDDFNKYKEEKDVKALKIKRDEQKAAATKRQTNISNANAAIQTCVDREPKILTEIEELEAKIVLLKEEKKKNAETVKNTKAWLDVNKAIDTKKIDKEYDDAIAWNAKFTEVETFRKKKEAYDEGLARTENLTVKYEASTQLLADTIKDMSLPIDGLKFTRDNLTYKGVPVDINTMSTSEIMHIGVQLKMARNPKVRILCIDRGESLGTVKKKQIQELAEKFDYFIIMEKVEEQKKGKERLIIEIDPK